MRSVEFWGDNTRVPLPWVWVTYGISTHCDPVHIANLMLLVGTSSNFGGSRPPKWCLFCIAIARARGEQGFSMVLTSEDNCESPDHGVNATCSLMRARLASLMITI